MLPKFFFPQAAVGGDYESAAPYWGDPRYAGQEKLDGARYILHKDDDGNVRIYSRQISRRTGEPVDKTAQLAHLAKEFMSLVPSGTVIDGEVCAPGATSSSNLVVRVTGSKPERSKEIQQKDGFLVFHAFDILAFDGKVLTEKPYEKRYERLYDVVYGGLHNFLKVLPVCFTEASKRDLYQKVLARGGEGIILKDVTAPYHQGKRDKSWVKVKRQRTFDVVFMGIELANETSVKKGDNVETATRIAGKAGAIRYGQYVNKELPFMDGLFAELTQEPELELKELGTVSGFDDATRDFITLYEHTLVGKVFEVTAQEQFDSGALRHPRFLQWRDDKRAEDCVFRKGEG